MVHLQSLEELCLTSNFFAKFPEFAMKMAGLKKVCRTPFPPHIPFPNIMNNLCHLVITLLQV